MYIEKRRRVLYLVLLLSLIIPISCGGSNGSGGPGAACSTNTDCLSTEYCAKAMGDCNGRGTCVVKPIACPLAPVSIADLVCGCDGQTYGYYIGACDAAKLGVNIAHKGACP